MRSMNEWGVLFWTSVFVVFILQIQRVLSQDDYSVPITCYICYGKAVNSTCADPVNARYNRHLQKRECLTGVCVKWTRYKKGILYIERTCSIQLNFHITMIDGVCRTERNGNGYLCMCGRHLCNAGTTLGESRSQLRYFTILLAGLFLLRYINFQQEYEFNDPL